jgi:hypothetical protein
MISGTVLAVLFVPVFYIFFLKKKPSKRRCRMTQRRGRPKEIGYAPEHDS